ncbi:hypothetical protein VE25_00065 [Devosia geojensis]|uniref:LTXXQ motif family protein n=1 Tax=Devosia geojensis TaxID=443610 RepID=A0A0F5G017_9HYPH|nr:Spy/CpxP family protein refolding chaperone [Devosia geojensis]KKB13797.1 hypothetical protein VE25_00065 [Devosia geojensis]
MKTISKTALVALTAASVGLAGIGTSAFAQTTTPTQVEAPGKPGDGAHRFHRKGPGGHAGLAERRMMIHHMGGPGAHGPRGGMGLLNFGSAEGLEIAFVRLSYAIDMNEDQRALFDTLKSDALSAQSDFETATEGLRFDRRAEERPDIVEIFNNRIAIETARLEAMQAVQPAFEAFFGSLSDEQKAELAPRRAHFERPGAPAAPEAPEEPAED